MDESELLEIRAAILLIGQTSWMETEIGTDGWIVWGAAVLVALCVFFLWLRGPRAKKRQE